MLIADVLKSKATLGIVTVRPDLTVAEVAQILTDHGIGAAVVSEDGEHVTGIVSERDIVRAVARGADLLDRPLREIMTTNVITCATGDQLEALAETMTAHRVRHIPVLADEVLVGIVSIGDIVKSRIEQLHAEKSHLESYIHG